MQYYTGIGSRSCPKDIQDLMQRAAFRFASEGYICRTGGAKGADKAFETGALKFSEDKEVAEIYIPWRGYDDIYQGDINRIIAPFLPKYTGAKYIAKRLHPAWEKLTRGGVALHTRNVFQVLGENLDNPSKFLICYAEPTGVGDHVKGGTGTAVKLAIENEVKIYNLWHEDTVKRLEWFLNEE